MRSANPLISIITVVFNGEQTIERMIKSVLNQAFHNFEFIILDGGSTDGTLDIIRRYDGQIDYWASRPDLGIYDAMNSAFPTASGEWIYFLGADDMMINCLHLVAECLKDSFAIYYGDVYLPKRNRLYDGPFSRFKLAWKNISQQAIFYPRKAFDNYRFSTRYPIQSDWEFNMRCMNDSSLRFRYFPILIAIFEDEKGLSSRFSDHQFNADYLRLLDRYFPCFIFTFFKALLTTGAVMRKIGFFKQTNTASFK